MADVSKIKVPNGTVYNIKDETARAGLAGKAEASHTHTVSQISDFPASLPIDGGNADTVNGRRSGRIATLKPDGSYWSSDSPHEFDAVIKWDGSDYFKLQTYSGHKTAADYAALAAQAKNSASLGGIVDAYHLGTIGASDNEHGVNYQLYCKHNIYGDNRFGLEIANRTHEVRVDYATYAGNALTQSKGIISGLTNGTAVTIPLSFSPAAVIFFNNYNHLVNSGFSLSLGTNQFVITPSSVSTMGVTTVTYIAFKG